MPSVFLAGGEPICVLEWELMKGIVHSLTEGGVGKGKVGRRLAASRHATCVVDRTPTRVTPTMVRPDPTMGRWDLGAEGG